LNLDQWPPQAVAHRNEYVVSFDVLRDGRFAVSSMLTQSQGEYAIRIHPSGWASDPAAGPTPDPAAGTAEVYPSPGDLTPADVWVIGGRVVVFDTLIQRDDLPGHHRAYLLDRGGFIEAPGLPPVTKFCSYGHQAHANGKVTLANGTDALLWDGDGYEWT